MHAAMAKMTCAPNILMGNGSAVVSPNMIVVLRKRGYATLKPCIGLIVPSLEQGGGVPAVARFVKDRVLYSGRYDLRLISLATSAQDESSVCISRPTTWGRGITTRHGQWQGLPFVHVGASISELEFQRYRPRRILADVVADCDILQVVCGSPAWAYAVCGLGRPVSLHCATRAKVERRRRDADPVTIVGWWRKAMTEITDNSSCVRAQW